MRISERTSDRSGHMTIIKSENILSSKFQTGIIVNDPIF